MKQKDDMRTPVDRRALLDQVGAAAVHSPREAAVDPYAGAIVGISAAVVSVNLLVILLVVLRRCASDHPRLHQAPALPRLVLPAAPPELRRCCGGGALECAVCLSRCRQPEALRLLSGCGHMFHVQCVDRWLESRSSCPLCRQVVNAEDVHTVILQHGVPARPENRDEQSQRAESDRASADSAREREARQADIPNRENRRRFPP